MTKFTTSILLTLVFAIGGCAHFTHFNDLETIEGQQAVFVDAKQRAFFAASKKTETTDADGKTSIREEFLGYCAEPSPDALSALAATIGADLSVPDKGKLAFSQALSEGATSIGVRTAAIQALRDFMYRNCEAYALGGITSNGLETLQRRFQSTMVGILAIEQLTGAVQAPAVTISSDASLGSADAILDLTNKVGVAEEAYQTALNEESEAKKNVEAAEKEVEAAQKSIDDHKNEVDELKKKQDEGQTLEAEEIAKVDGFEAKQGELKALLSEKSEAKKKLDDSLELAVSKAKKTKQAYEALETSRVAATTAGGKASAIAQISPTNLPKPIDQQTVSTLSKAVVDIVRESTQGNYWNEMCTTVVSDLAEKVPAPGSTLALCNALISARGDTTRERQVSEAYFSNFAFPEAEEFSNGERRELTPNQSDDTIPEPPRLDQ